MPVNKVELGDKCKDLVTGFVGVAICRHTYLQGCDRITLQSAMKANTGSEEISFDEPQLKIVKKAVVPSYEKGANSSVKRGGPAKHMDNGRTMGSGRS